MAHSRPVPETVPRLADRLFIGMETTTLCLSGSLSSQRLNPEHASAGQHHSDQQTCPTGRSGQQPAPRITSQQITDPDATRG
jgi:hypothetical protein